MLEDIDSVIKYYEIVAESDVEFRDMLLSRRVHPVEIKINGLGLPAEYIEFAESYKIEGVSIGMLELTPMNLDSLSQSLYALNFEMKNPKVSDGFSHVANFEGDLILLNKSEDSHNNSKVYYLDISTGIEKEPTCVSESFVKFIVTAANLDKIRMECENEIRSNFASIVELINPSIGEAGMECWSSIYLKY